MCIEFVQVRHRHARTGLAGPYVLAGRERSFLGGWDPSSQGRDVPRPPRHPERNEAIKARGIASNK